MTFFEGLCNALRCLGFGAGITLSARTLFHYFQLESYQFPGYRKSVLRNFKKSVFPGTLFFFVAILLHVILSLLSLSGKAVGNLLACIVYVGAGVLIRNLTKDTKAKKKFAITPRVKRLYFVSLLVHALLFFAAQQLPGVVWALVLPLLLPCTAALAGLCAWPIEKLISELYFRDAQRILSNRPDLIKIGITGSYGKTSVKFILGTLLSEKYQTLVTPSSFNTPMGLTKVIRTQLKPAHQVFVAEMGARHVGDIKELCRLVAPTYGVITSVGPQHLDTFKTIERIASTKYELMDAIPANGVRFFPNDGKICLDLYQKTTKQKRIVSFEDASADVWAENIAVSSVGSTFTLCTKEEQIVCQTSLLGKHNIQNIVLASAVALELGLTLRQIAHGISRLTPVEHRLQLIQNNGGMTIIDDAFNSNPNGAEKALEVLSAFPPRRMIITPGMVELGADEAKFNRLFGEKMASCTDIAILVGKNHTAPIREGLLAKGFDERNIHVTSSLEEAANLMRQIGQAGDTVLFENDLPDNYSE